MLASHVPEVITRLAREPRSVVNVVLGHFQTPLGLSSAALVPWAVSLILQLPHPH